MVKTIQLKDGRTLAYAEYGDPRGKPVFFFHGTPGSRFFRPPDEITCRLGARLITIDRPGYGGSTFQPGRRIPDWPAEVASLADFLGLDRFAVCGHSGGGPYALACAWAMPERVAAAASLSGAGPLDSPNALKDMTTLNRIGFRFGRHLSWPLWRILIRSVYRRQARDPAAAMDRQNGRRPAADDGLLSRPEVRAACLESEREAFRPGLDGLAQDAFLLVRPWGFPLEVIRVPVHFWHGTDDNLTPLPMAQYLASRIPDARLTICTGEAHLLLFSHWQEILTQLTG
jgi:pimeloyl-ACP methyl ester carboxylesterase